MFTPYAAAGAGWGNLSGKATGAWDVGGGLKFELSRDVQASVDYRYIQTMAPNPVAGLGQQANARGGNNLIGAVSHGSLVVKRLTITTLVISKIMALLLPLKLINIIIKILSKSIILFLKFSFRYIKNTKLVI